MRPTKPKVLFYDIETTPNVSYTWGKYDQNVIEFKKEWELLSFAYKYQGESKVTCLTQLSEGDEQSLVESLHRVLSTADLVIAHNGKDFDNKKSQAKFIEYGLTPLRLTTIDTKQEAKRHFRFNSNKLDDLGKLLGVGRKIKNIEGFQLWLDCMAGKTKAFKQMARYNVQDVRLLEQVYDKLRPWVKHPWLGQNSGCLKCGGYLRKRGVRRTTKNVYQTYQCKDCGGWSQNRQASSENKPDKVDL